LSETEPQGFTGALAEHTGRIINYEYAKYKVL